MEELKAGDLPRHVAIIMDGNGRWAKKRLLPRSMGHRMGMKRMLSLVEHIFDRGVEICTLFTLSTENLSRPKEEIEGLYSLIRSYLTQNVLKLKKRGVRFRAIGEPDLLPEDIVRLIRESEQSTVGGTRGTLVLAIGYGGRQDIVRAVNQAVKLGEAVTAESFSRLLSTGDLPEPDLLIRTGHELRLSNFLLWQIAYTELYFTDTLFPDFTAKKLDKALEAYACRERRFGKL